MNEDKLQRNFNDIYESLYAKAEKISNHKNTLILVNKEAELFYLTYQKGRFLFTHNLLKRFVNGKKKKLKILDVGASHFTELLKKTGLDVASIDMNLGWKKRFRNENIVLKKCNLIKEKIPFKNKSFDIILFNEVLEHLPINPKNVISDFYRLLKENGVLIISTPNFADSINRISLLLGRNPQEMFKNNDYIGATHIREYTLKEVKEVLEKNNFSVIETYRPMYFDNPWIRKTLSAKIIRTIIYPIIFLIPPLRRAIVVIAKKIHSTKKHIKKSHFD